MCNDQVYYHGFWRSLHGTLYSWDPGRIISSWYQNYMRIKMVFFSQEHRHQKKKKKTRNHLHASIQLPCFLALFYKSILCNAVNITDWSSDLSHPRSKNCSCALLKRLKRKGGTLPLQFLLGKFKQWHPMMVSS